MPFVQLVDGESAILEIVSAEATIQFQHWIKGVAFQCMGDKCPFCAQRVRRNARFLLNVRWGGEAFTWGLSKTLYGMLQWLAKDRADVRGMFVELTRLGEGVETQWRLDNAEGPPPAKGVAGATAPTVEAAAAHDAQVKLLDDIKLLQTMLVKIAADRRAPFEQELANLKSEFLEKFGELPEGRDEIPF